ncbi:hypothetical protein LTR37_008078 [Vermiconidia calcicola]|uniref:Uncharacterized protein n=1 Tax=Vermiconidia calcicola TaxID=1690605 RepID=A0ACC3NBR3_9PEZI|nr:hypothetical protein LTR37_008078 [Vermiconidia calcicola]
MYESAIEIARSKLGLNDRLRLDRRNRLAGTKKLREKAKQRRKRALDKLYQITQEEIDHPPEEENNTSHSLPDVFFNEFGVLLACRTYVQGHTDELQTARLRLIELSSRLGGLDPRTEEAEALRDQRYEASDEHTQLRADSAIYAQILTEYVETVLEIARPYLDVASRSVDVHTEAENVSRGADHVPLDDEALTEEAKAIPSRYSDLLEALEAAVRLTEGAQRRHSKLARDYYRDLKKSLEDSPELSREDFDRQFVKDRAQAMGDIVVAERHYDRLVKRLRDEQLLPLEDRVSQFGSVSGDGQTCTLGPEYQAELRRRREMDLQYTQAYLRSVNNEDLASPSKAVQKPDERHDSNWDARPIEVGDIDGVSTAGKNTREGIRIQEWRSSMERLRKVELPREMEQLRETQRVWSRSQRRNWCTIL